MRIRERKFFPLSLKGINRFGFKRWMNSNKFKINLSRNINFNRKNILENYKKIFLNTNDRYLKYVAISNYDLLDTILYLQQFYEIIEILRSKNIKRVYLDKKTEINNINIEEEIFENYFKNSFLDVSDIKPFYKVFLKNFISYIDFFIFKKKKITLLSENIYINKLFPKKNYSYFYYNFRDKKSLINYENENYIDSKINILFKKIFKKNIKKIPFGIIKKITLSFCLNYEFLKNKKIKLPNNYFVPNLHGKSKLRAFAIKSLMNNIKYCGFIHGNPVLNFEVSPDSFYYNGPLSLGGECIISSSSEKYRIKKHLKKLPKPIKKLKFKINKNLYQKKIIKCNNKNKTILLMGYPMSNDFYYWAKSFHAFNMLRIETSIINLCKKNNYKIDYKIHPDKINVVKDLYTKEKIKIIYEPLESILDNYEYVICPHPISTTFSYILYLSNAKVIMFNHKEFKWDKKIFNFLLKRAEIINLYNYNNTMKFNNKKFLNSVKNIMSKNYIKHNYKLKL